MQKLWGFIVYSSELSNSWELHMHLLQLSTRILQNLLKQLSMATYCCSLHVGPTVYSSELLIPQTLGWVFLENCTRILLRLSTIILQNLYPAKATHRLTQYGHILLFLVIQVVCGAVYRLLKWASNTQNPWLSWVFLGNCTPPCSLSTIILQNLHPAKATQYGHILLQQFRFLYVGANTKGGANSNQIICSCLAKLSRN